MAQAGKPKDSATKKGGKGDSFKPDDRDNVLQAVVIADSFNERFKPLTLQTPRALLPVVNCPTIEYTLDFLAGCGVTEILIFCRAHADKIRGFIESHWKWGLKGRRHRTVSVQVIMSENCYSMGDALREIDSKNAIRSDFILVQGDLIANVDLQPALEAHKKRRLTDKDAIMTIVCRQVASRHPARTLEEQVVLAVEPSTNRVLHYQKTGTSKKIGFPLDIFDGRDEVEVRCDLIDCHISICSANVPPLFSDNFDYLTRGDFIRGILINEEVMGNKIHCHFLTVGYTARISNLHMYDVISRDIISRWVYPYCADLGFPDGEQYSYRRHHIYLHKNVELSMGCVLEENVLLGKGAVVGENTRIRNSVIGNGSVIGKNCLIDGAYLWRDCVIEDDCHLVRCILADGCRVKNHSMVNSGCILSYGVVIGPEAKIPSENRIIGKQDFDVYQQPGDEDAEEEASAFDIAPADEHIRGSEGGDTWTFQLQETSADDSGSETTDINFEKINWKWTSVDNFHTEGTDEESSDEDLDDIDGTEAQAGHQVEDIRVFFHEASDSLMRAVEETVNPENVVLEINSSKFAYNVTMREVNKLIIRAIIEIPELRYRAQKKEFRSAKEASGAVTTVFETLLPVLKNYFRSATSQTDLLSALEECVVYYQDLSRHQPYGNFLTGACPNILMFLYENDVLTEGVIEKWYSEPVKSHAHGFLPFFLHEALASSPRRRHISGGDMSDDEAVSAVKKIETLRQKLAPFMKWLREAEEESESE